MLTRPPRPRSRASRIAADDAGRRGERIAGWWLRLKGWRILGRRVRTKAGEVDLIAKRGTVVAFVEVSNTPRRTVHANNARGSGNVRHRDHERSHHLRPVFQG